MKITEEVIKAINSICEEAYHESGGILGAENKVINHVVFDRGLGKLKCSYVPDVDLLNKSIAKWTDEGITFLGIYHTHFFGVETLSQGDMEYIHAILAAMPEEITQLYFPIVLPEYQRIVPYRAERTPCGISIQKEELVVVDKVL